MRVAASLALPALFALWPSGDVTADNRRSGYDDMSADLKALQDDPMANPGVFWLFDGERLYSEPVGPTGTSCANCHGPGDSAMAGVATRYPAWDRAEGRAFDLTGRIQQCQARWQKVDPSARESPALLALTAYVTHQSRGQPIVPDAHPRMDMLRAEGQALFSRRIGQLDLACDQCHDDNAGGRLAAAHIPEAHPTGYPQYRLQWETMGSLTRRLGNCMTGVRSEPFVAGSRPMIALEAYLKARAAGLLIEALPIRP